MAKALGRIQGLRGLGGRPSFGLSRTIPVARTTSRRARSGTRARQPSVRLLRPLQRGHTVRFTTLSAALADLLKQESLPALERRLRKYTAPSLLILDEIGYLPCSRQSADMLYNIISRRHETRSLVLTTNVPFKQWSTVFPGAACVSAMIDRFVQHCHIVDIDADSWRQKESLAMSELRPEAPHDPPEPPLSTPTKKKR